MDLKALLDEAKREVGAAIDLRALDSARVKFLGKKGSLTAALKGLGALPASERPAAGAAINEAKTKVQAMIDAREAALQADQPPLDCLSGAGSIGFWTEKLEPAVRNNPCRYGVIPLVS